MSPRLGLRFARIPHDFEIFTQNGQRFPATVGLTQHMAQDKQRANQAQQRADRLAAQLRALGVEAK